MTKLVIRKVTADKDATAHCLRWLQAACLPYDEPRALEGDEWWIAYLDGLPVAFASLRLMPEEDMAYLSRAGVLPAARGQGLQKRLIRKRVQFAKAAGVQQIVTDTTDNPASGNSLIAEGFRLYHPGTKWALPESIYWSKKL